ncbi:MAG: tetratricopeptide repeat protein [Thermomicrobiales bacterium]
MEHPLPRPLTPFIGRTIHVAAVRQYLRNAEIRLVTLTGPGGVGKTRLALSTAADCDHLYADGCHLINLAEVRRPELVLSTIVHQLGYREEPRQSAADQLAQVLRDKTLLLLLDNCEHVTAAAASLATLLERCPGLTILATSRTALHIQGEHEYPVPPMGLPNLSSLEPLAVLRQCEAVALFLQRARAARPDFTLTESNASDVADLCVRLDGLPLAIELAAARVKVLSPAALAARLSGRLQLLTGGAQDLPARLQSMRDTIGWSYDLLTGDEQALFRRLSVFAGGFTFDAAEAVGGESLPRSIGGAARREGGKGSSSLSLPPRRLAASPPDVLDHLAALIDHGLVQRIDRDEAEPRYQMLESIREFGQEQLTASAEDAEMRTRHASWCVTLAETAAPELRGPNQGHWLERIAAERDNLHAAQDWILATGHWSSGIRLALALYTFWLIRGSSHDDSVWLERLLDITPDGLDTDHAVRRARAIHLLGVLRHSVSDYAAAERWYTASLARRQTLGDLAGQEATLHNLALLAMGRGDAVRASAIAERAIAVCRELGEPSLLAVCLGNYADALISLGHHDRAQTALDEAVDLLRGGSTPREHALYLLRLGDTARWGRGEVETARSLYEEALSRFQHLGDERYAAVVLAHLSYLAFETGQHARAARYVAEALALGHVSDDRGWVATFLDCQSAIAVALGCPEPAARLLGAADALRQGLEIVPLPLVQTERGRTLTALQAALGEPRVAAFRADGRALTCQRGIQEAIAFADTIPEHETITPVPQSAKAADTLTRRERDVLRLLVDGRSDKEIAEALSLGHRTIATHVSNILAKFGVPTRAAAVAHALRHGFADAPPPADTSFDAPAAHS